MKTKNPQSVLFDVQAVGSQSKTPIRSDIYYPSSNCTSMDSYVSINNYNNHNESAINQDGDAQQSHNNDSQSISSGYKKAKKIGTVAKDDGFMDYDAIDNDVLNRTTNDAYYEQKKAELDKPDNNKQISAAFKDSLQKDNFQSQINTNDQINTFNKVLRPMQAYEQLPDNEVPERVFMNGLLKHTAIALAIIIPLAAFSAYAATPNMPTKGATPAAKTSAKITIPPSSIIHKSATKPTTVDNVDLAKYSGTWYEIGRLPMYFQRNCASDVTATYTPKANSSDVTVVNKCATEDGSIIEANGQAKAVDETGSKLKVTFLPSWVRWLPVGRADYWVLARDNDYQTALVGTPDLEYLWLLARSPNIDQQTYARYRQIAQQQGYDLKEFKLTPHANQTVKLVP